MEDKCTVCGWSLSPEGLCTQCAAAAGWKSPEQVEEAEGQSYANGEEDGRAFQSKLLESKVAEAVKAERERIGVALNRAQIGMAALPSEPSEFWKGYWQGQIEVLTVLKSGHAPWEGK